MSTTTSSPISLAGDPRRRRRERRIGRALFLAASLSILVSIGIVYSLLGGATRFLAHVDLSLLVSEGWFPRRDLFDVRTLVVGSVLVSTIAMLIAAPLGLGAAIYLAEYARPRARRVLKPILEILAGVPSIVLGYFALTWINPNLVQTVVPGAPQFNLVSAGIGVGILVTPLMASISEDALRAVPGSLREASAGLGARPITTTFRVVLPAAVSGIVAAAIVSVSRAIGETMVIALAAGAAAGALFGLDPLRGGQTLTGAIASLAAGTDQVAGGQYSFESLFFVGLLLFVFTLLLNVAGDRVVRRYRKAY
ncbi:MAG TPA: phosphate ABC transporter permease subunit PstC [Egicoccus sp.]|nr:phosphate ABC transporter permease subunit PstC [Egicoccus sp.]HSK22787.1 phosphate ABC transporter permease subunit PstC [Egicoccus sp.]